MSVMIQSILDVPTTGPGYLPVLAATIAGPAKDRVSIEKDIDQLADALLAGSLPDELRDLTDSGAKYDNVYFVQHQKGWMYGQPGDRVALIRLLWARALAPDAVEQRRPVYAKAAMLMAAHEDLIFGDAAMTLFYARFEQFSKISKLTPSQVDRLRTLLQRLIDCNQAAAQAGSDANEAEAAIIKAPAGSMPMADVQREIDALKREWSAQSKSPGSSVANQSDAIFAASRLRNLANARKSPDSQKAVDDLLLEWKAEKWPDPINRWLEEVSTTFGPAPTRSRIGGPGRPNG